MSTPSIEDVLAAHDAIGYDDFDRCTCGWADGGTHEQHRAHVADAIRAHLAEHTDEAVGAVERYPHGVAWEDRLNIVCLCGQVCIAEIGQNPAGGFIGRPGSDTYVRRPAAQAFAQHLLDVRRAALAGGASGAAEEADATGHETAVKVPRNYAGVEVAPEDHRTPVRNSDGDSGADQ